MAAFEDLLPTPYNKKKFEEQSAIALKLKHEKSTSPRTSAFAKQEEGKDNNVEYMDELPFDPLNSTHVVNRAIAEEHARRDIFTERIFNNSPEAVELYQTFGEDPKSINPELMKILIRNKSASKIQSKWKKWKLKNNPTPNQISFMQKIFTFFKSKSGGKSKKSKKFRKSRKSMKSKK